MTPEQYIQEFSEEFPRLGGLYNTESGWMLHADPKKIEKFFIDTIIAVLTDQLQKANSRFRPEEKTLLSVQGRDNYFYNLALSDVCRNLEWAINEWTLLLNK